MPLRSSCRCSDPAPPGRSRATPAPLRCRMRLAPASQACRARCRHRPPSLPNPHQVCGRGPPTPPLVDWPLWGRSRGLALPPPHKGFPKRWRREAPDGNELCESGAITWRAVRTRSPRLGGLGAGKAAAAPGGAALCVENVTRGRLATRGLGEDGEGVRCAGRTDGPLHGAVDGRARGALHVAPRRAGAPPDKQTAGPRCTAEQKWVRMRALLGSRAGCTRPSSERCSMALFNTGSVHTAQTNQRKTSFKAAGKSVSCRGKALGRQRSMTL